MSAAGVERGLQSSEGRGQRIRRERHRADVAPGRAAASSAGRRGPALQVAGPPFVVAAGPAVHPLTGAGPLHELEPVLAGVVKDLVVRHPAIVAQG